MAKTIYKPRGDRVLLRKVKIEESESGLAFPDYSIEGSYYLVEAIGKEVKEVELGDKVLLVGKENLQWAYIPNTKDLIITREDCIWLSYGEEDE
jgi:co-chaperonin GroES (HSP10)